MSFTCACESSLRIRWTVHAVPSDAPGLGSMSRAPSPHPYMRLCCICQILNQCLQLSDLVIDLTALELILLDFLDRGRHVTYCPVHPVKALRVLLLHLRPPSLALIDFILMINDPVQEHTADLLFLLTRPLLLCAASYA